MKLRLWLLRILLILLIVIFVVPLLIPLPTVGADPRTLADEDGRFVEVNGLDIYYIARGPTDGQPIMLLHGLGGSTFSWRDNLTPLADAGFRVVAFDRPPFGLTEKSNSVDVSAPAQADIAAGLMDRLGIESAIMVGHSAGGGVIAHFALQYPDRVDGLIFVAGAVGAGGGGAPAAVGGALSFPSFNRWLRIGARALVTPEWYGNTLATAFHDQTQATEAVRAGYGRVLQVRDWDIGFAALLRDSSRNAFPEERLPELDMPSLLIWGRADTWVPLARGEALLAALPNATLTIYDDVGHLPAEEAPERFNADVIAWLNEQISKLAD
jgi:pimeloyl-ACP methyl ester carboxylesterase